MGGGRVNKGGRPPLDANQRLSSAVCTRLTTEAYHALLDAYPRCSPSEALRRLVDTIPSGNIEVLRREREEAETRARDLAERERVLAEEIQEATMQAEHEEHQRRSSEEAQAMRSKQIGELAGELAGKITAWVNTVVADPSADPVQFVASLGVEDAEVREHAAGLAERALERRRRLHAKKGGPS